MQNYFKKHREISEFKELREFREFREFRDIHCKFIKLPILIKLLTFLLPGITLIPTRAEGSKKATTQIILRGRSE